MENSLNENVFYYVVNSIIFGSKEARASIVLDIEWAQFVLQNGEKLQNYRFKKGEEKHIVFEVCMIKNRQTGIVLFSSDHMYKNTDKRYILKTGLHTARFVAKIYLWSKPVEHKSFSKHKKTGLFFFGLPLREECYLSIGCNRSPATEEDSRVLHKIMFRGYPIISIVSTISNGVVGETMN